MLTFQHFGFQLLVVQNLYASIQTAQLLLILVGDKTALMVIIMAVVDAGMRRVYIKHAKAFADGNTWSHQNEVVNKSRIVVILLLVQIVI